MLTKEELSTKYLIYSPDITEEIFNKIVQKLKALGLQWTTSPSTFKTFNKPKGYLYIGKTSFHVQTGRPLDCINVSDILGEDWNKSTTSISKKDLKIGTIYRFDWFVDGEKRTAICKYTDPTFTSNEILFLHQKRYQKFGEGLSASFEGIEDSIKLATQEEINHLIQCRNAGKYVEYNSKETTDKKWWESLKKGDYIIFNATDKASGGFKFNFIYKVEKLYLDSGYKNIFNSDGVRVEKDCSGTSNGWAAGLFRLATTEEIKLYEHAGKPVDVTTYKITEEKDLSFIRVNDLVKNEIYYCSYLNKHGKSRSGIFIYKGKRHPANPEKEYYLIADILTLDGQKFTGFSNKEWTDYIRKATKEEKKLFYEAYPNYQEFVLPEKWCVALTKENAKVLGRWRKAGYCGVLKEENPHGYIYSNIGEWVQTRRTDYTEITFEQFKEHVLKEKGVEMKKPNRLYLEDLVEGDIYYMKTEHDYIFSYKNNSCVSYCCSHLINNLNSFIKKGGSITGEGDHIVELRKATEEEQKWLKACIKAGKFISKKEALKSIPKFEIGKWYKHLEGEHYCKFEGFWKEDTDKLKCTEYITEDKRYHKTSSGYIGITDKTVECPLEEIQKYLPDGHVDKFVKEKEMNKFNYKFKVGDKVKVIHHGLGCVQSELNKEVEITERGKYFFDPGYKVSPAIGNTADGQFNGYIGEKSFELITSEKEEYKVGDWVYLVKNVGKSARLGALAVIYSITSEYIYVYWKYNSNSQNDGAYYPTDFRLATPEEVAEAKQDKYYDPIKPKLEWKVGAYVRYKGTKLVDNLWEKFFGKYGVVEGDVGIIKRYDYKNRIFVEDKIRSTAVGVLCEQDLELITKEEYERGLRKDISPQEVLTLEDLNCTSEEVHPKKQTKTDKVKVQLINVPRI